MALSTDHSTRSVADILGAIAASTEAVAQQKPGAREKVLALSHQLVSALETPSETIQRMGWAEVCDSSPKAYNLMGSYAESRQPARFAATQLAVDLNIFEKLEEAHDAPVSLSNLTESTGADAALLGGLSSIVPLTFKAPKSENAHYLHSQDNEASFGHERGW